MHWNTIRSENMGRVFSEITDAMTVRWGFEEDRCAHLGIPLLRFSVLLSWWGDSSFEVIIKAKLTVTTARNYNVLRLSRNIHLSSESTFLVYPLRDLLPMDWVDSYSLGELARANRSDEGFLLNRPEIYQEDLNAMLDSGPTGVLNPDNNNGVNPIPELSSVPKVILIFFPII